jgi:hypothetical protein
LARYLAAEVGAESVNDAVVIMALPDRNQPGEQQDFEVWRRRLMKLRNFGVRHERARFSYRDLICNGCESTLGRHIVCPVCGVSNPVAGRRKEKGADIKLATIALNGAWRQEYAELIILSQDSDFGPMITQVKEVHRRQGRHYALYSAFPVCQKRDHEHRGIPGTQPLHLGPDTFAALLKQPYADCRAPLAQHEDNVPGPPARIAL